MIVHNCEQGSEAWHSLRLGMPTASNAAKLVYGSGQVAKTETMKGYAQELAAELYAGEELDAWEGNKYTERGHEVEDLARKWYAYEHGVNVHEVGFCTDDLQRYGASPDGLIGPNDNWTSGAEYKCLPVNHLKTLLYFNKNKKPEPKYLPQVHQNILVCELEYMDLVYYHQKLPSLVIRVHRDESFLSLLKSQLSLCIEHRDETLELLRNYGSAA